MDHPWDDFTLSIEWVSYGERFYINDSWVPHKVYTIGTYSIIGTHYIPGMIYHNFVVPFSYEIYHVILPP